jgi:hypothetical protein
MGPRQAGGARRVGHLRVPNSLLSVLIAGEPDQTPGTGCAQGDGLLVSGSI